jgi:hypothetical protein
MKKVIIRRGDRLLDVAPFIRETKTMVIAGHKGQYQIPKKIAKRIGQRKFEYEPFRFPTPKEIAKAEKELADREAEKRAWHEAMKEKERREQADPRYKLLRRFSGGADFEPWRELTLEQLQTIADIFDSVKK